MSTPSIGNPVVRATISVIQLYRHMVSPLRPATCRFIPTCSQYAVAALAEYGMLRGSWLAVARLAKCGPWHRGGWDPIPERRADFDDAAVDRAAPQRGSDTFV